MTIICIMYEFDIEVIGYLLLPFFFCDKETSSVSLTWSLALALWESLFRFLRIDWVSIIVKKLTIILILLEII